MNLFRSKRHKDPTPDPISTGRGAASDNADPSASPPKTPPSSDPRVYARVRSECRIRFQDLGRNELQHGPGIEAVTYDVSGGGVLILAADRGRSMEGHSLDLELYLPKTEPIRVRGIVVRDKPNGTARDRTEIAVEFTDIRENDRNTILRYVFAQQSERRRLGLL